MLQGPKILPKNNRVDSQTQALIQHRIGFFPPIFEEQPVIDTNRIDINHAKDLVPRVSVMSTITERIYILNIIIQAADVKYSSGFLLDLTL